MPIPDPIVRDLNGQRRDLAWLASYWGVPLDIQRADPHPACPHLFRLTEIAIRQGPAVQIVACLQADGSPYHRTAVARWWQDAPALPPYPDDCHATRWKPNAVIGWTDAAGVVGFGMGGGDRPGSSGVWPLHCEAPGDWVGNLGMHAERNHETLALTFQLMPANEPPPEPPEPPASGDLAAIAQAIHALNATLRQALRLD